LSSIIKIGKIKTETEIGLFDGNIAKKKLDQKQQSIGILHITYIIIIKIALLLFKGGQLYTVSLGSLRST